MKIDGRVAAWGNNGSGQRNVPVNLTNAMTVTAGLNHSLALRIDSSVVGWGSILPPTGLSNVIALAGGDLHGLALKRNGTLTAWGQNLSGQTNIPSGLSNVVAIAAGAFHNLALRCDGTVVAWGQNSLGQTNVPDGLSNVIAIASGVAHNVALKSDGTVVAWGANEFGQTNVPVLPGNVVSVAAGASNSLAVTSDGSVIGWGQDNFKQSTAPADLRDVFAVDSGTTFTLALKHGFQPFAHTQAPAPIRAQSATLNGMVTPNGLPTTAWFEWGPDSGFNQTTAIIDLGNGLDVQRVVAPIEGLTANQIYRCRLVASNLTGLTYGMIQRFTTGQRAVSWGYAAGFGFVKPPPGLSNIVSLTAGDYHAIAISNDGSVTNWGGWGSFSLSPLKPYIPADLTNVIAVAGGRDVDVALKADGTVVVWGADLSGQTNVPPGVTNVIAISAGDEHVLALRSDGTVAAWGRFGLSLIPALVPAGIDHVVAISSGDTQCMALKDDGTVAVWSSSVIGFINVTNAIAIKSDYQHNVVLRADGTVLDVGGTTVPSGLTNVVAIASGDYFTMALKNDGSLTSWGTAVAAPPLGLAGIVAIVGGDEFRMALAANTPPQAIPRTFNGPANQDWVVNLTSSAYPVVVDPNGDLIACRIVSLPTAGWLYQYTADGRGNAISETNTPVTDSLNRVIFAPAAGESGVPYSSFSVVGNDGEFDSLPSLVTLGVVPIPTIAFAGFDVNARPMLSFAGMTNVNYSVWASTNLVNWTKLGNASQPNIPGEFLYTDSTVGNLPERFYQVRSP